MCRHSARPLWDQKSLRTVRAVAAPPSYTFCFFEIDYRVGAINSFQRKDIGQLLTRHLLAIIFRGPSQQTKKIDEGIRQKSGIAIRGDADHRTMFALGEFRSIRARPAMADAQTAEAAASCALQRSGHA